MPQGRIVNLHLEIEQRAGSVGDDLERGEPVLLALVLPLVHGELDDLELFFRRELGAVAH